MSPTTAAVGSVEARQALGMGACASGPRPVLALPCRLWSAGLGDSRQLCLLLPPGPLTQASLSSVCKVSTLLCCQVRLEQQDGSLSLERNPVSSLHSQQACNQFPSREALLHCIENWSGTESFWLQCLLGYDFGLLLVPPTSSGQHNFTLYCNEKTTQHGLGFVLGAVPSSSMKMITR